MAIVTPVPLGGLAGVIGTLQQRLQLLEAARAGTASLFVPGEDSAPATGGWTVPTSWTPLDVEVDSTAGAFVIAGCTLETPAAGTVTNVFFGVGVDTYTGSYGNQGEWSAASGTTTGDPYPLNAVGWWPISGGGGAPISMGSHTFSPQLAVSGTGTLLVRGMYLVVVPL